MKVVAKIYNFQGTSDEFEVIINDFLAIKILPILYILHYKKVSKMQKILDRQKAKNASLKIPINDDFYTDDMFM